MRIISRLGWARPVSMKLTWRDDTPASTARSSWLTRRRAATRGAEGRMRFRIRQRARMDSCRAIYTAGESRAITCQVIDALRRWIIVVSMSLRMKLFAAMTLLLASTAFADSARIASLLREVPLIDGHNDLPYQYQERVKNHLAQIDIRQDQSKLTPALHTRERIWCAGPSWWSPLRRPRADLVRGPEEESSTETRIRQLRVAVFP